MKDAPAVPPHGTPFSANRENAPAYWAFGVLWVVLVDSSQTGGASEHPAPLPATSL